VKETKIGEEKITREGKLQRLVRQRLHEKEESGKERREWNKGAS